MVKSAKEKDYTLVDGELLVVMETCHVNHTLVCLVVVVKAAYMHI